MSLSITINFEECPSQIKVGHYLFDIVFCETDEFNHYQKHGQASEESCIIYVRLSNHINAFNTLMHEILHSIHFFMNLRDDSTEEEFTSLGTNGLLNFWYDNPVFTDWHNNQIRKIRNHMNEATQSPKIMEYS